MNLLLDRLPHTVTVNGRQYAINTAHFIGIQFELLMRDVTVPDNMKIPIALALYYPETPPDSLAAFDRALWFYACGAYDGAETESAHSGAEKQLYDFEQDAGLIYAAFRQQYGIDLTVDTLHWWAFRALLSGVSEPTQFAHVMSIRATDTSKMQGDQKAYYTKLKKAFAIQSTRTKKRQTLEERNAQMRAYIERRYKEVRNR